jgi:hypothetical protein
LLFLNFTVFFQKLVEHSAPCKFRPSYRASRRRDSASSLKNFTPACQKTRCKR